MTNPTSVIYTLSLHDALPISWPKSDWRSTYFVPENLKASVERARALKPLLPDGMTLPEMALRFILKDRKSTRLNSSHSSISYAVFCLKKKIYHIIILDIHCPI